MKGVVSVEDVFTFAKGFYEEGNLRMDKLVPRLQVKLREELCLKGRKIPYDDFSKFVKRGSSYTPLVCCSSTEKDDIVLDLSPVISVGIAELLTMVSYEDDVVDLKYIGWLNELEFASDWYSMLETAGKLFDVTADINSHLALTETLRSGLIDFRFPTVRRIYASLQALKTINPKSYCVAVIEAMRVCYAAITLFMNKDAVFKHNRVGYISHAQYTWEGRIKTYLSRFGAVEYTPEGQTRTRRITDGRGVGIGLFGMFMFDLFNKFADASGVAPVVPISDPTSRNNLENVFLMSLGDDFVGRYLRNGSCRVMSCSNTIVAMGNEANFLTLDCNNDAELNGITVGRGFVEGHILWKHATGVKEFETTGVLPPVDVSYGTRVDIVHACLDFVYSDRGMRMNTAIAKAQSGELIDAVLRRVDANATLERYRQEIEQSASSVIQEAQRAVIEKDEETESLRVALASANSSLAEKQRIIDELRAEVQSLRMKVRSTYSEEEFEAHAEEEEVAVSDVSTEEMLAFVNQFRIVVLGGYDTMQQRLEEAGFTNLYFLQSERVLNNTKASGDFFCICTKFVSHKLAFGAETHYSDQLDSFFYFNGTNTDLFLRTCYDFIHGWFESDDKEVS